MLGNVVESRVPSSLVARIEVENEDGIDTEDAVILDVAFSFVLEADVEVDVEIWIADKLVGGFELGNGVEKDG